MIGSVLAMLVIADATPSLDDVFVGARQYQRDTFHFQVPSQDRLMRMRALVAAIAQAVGAGKSPEPSAARAREVDLELVAAHDAAGPVWLLREAGAARRGDGLYLFRPGGTAVCLQAPHTFFDKGTGEIALGVFADLKAACLFTNTVHRYSPGTEGEHPADVAHAPRTLFAAATEGLLQARPLPLVQLHGFGAQRGIPPDVLAVVSDGTDHPAADGVAARLLATLKGLLPPGRALLFGPEIHDLGATTNVQGALARRAGVPFVHLEMNESLRQHLRANGPRAVAEGIRQALGRR